MTQTMFCTISNILDDVTNATSFKRSKPSEAHSMQECSTEASSHSKEESSYEPTNPSWKQQQKSNCRNI